MIYLGFERLVAELLSNDGFRAVSEPLGDRRDNGVDIVAVTSDGSDIPVQIKLVSTPQVSPRQLRDFSSDAARTRRFAILGKPLLVVGGDVNPTYVRSAVERDKRWQRHSARNADGLRSTALRAGTYLPPGTESSNPPSSSAASCANPTSSERGPATIDLRVSLSAAVPHSITSSARARIVPSKASQGGPDWSSSREHNHRQAPEHGGGDGGGGSGSM
jgi:hypothetical protein